MEIFPARPSSRSIGNESGQLEEPLQNDTGGVISLVADADHEEKEFTRLQGVWEIHMRDLSPKKRHLKVEVLLLYWQKTQASYLDTEEEVNNLEKVFRESYNYNVHRCILNHPDHGNPMLWINLTLADFVEKHDSDNSLLIIYYAGHGIPNKKGGLSLRGYTSQLTSPGVHANQSFSGNPNSTKSQKNEVDEIAWSKTEGIIDCAEKADFLLIFDCCFAGKLVGYQSRKDFSKTNFDFLGASGAGELAEIPGEKSFTHAMIKALEEFAKTGEGFTTSELCNQIREWPTFPSHEQTPFIVNKKNCVERLSLAPLPKTDTMPAPAPCESEETPTPPYCLRLDFLLPNLPSENGMVEICNGFKQLIHDKKLMAQKISWNSLHRKEVVSAVARAAALTWMAEIYRRKSRHGLSVDRKRSFETMNEGLTESSPLEKTDSPLELDPGSSELNVNYKKRKKT